MIVYLYTERGVAQCDGPFVSFDEVVASQLFGIVGVCAWVEERIPDGWYYENCLWTGDRWLRTSIGVRPASPIRPDGVLAQPFFPRRGQRLIAEASRRSPRDGAKGHRRAEAP